MVEIKALKKKILNLQKKLQVRWELNMAEPLYDYDPAFALNSEEAIAIFMADAFETGDAAYIAKALGVVARAKGMTKDFVRDNNNCSSL